MNALTEFYSPTKHTPLESPLSFLFTSFDRKKRVAVRIKRQLGEELSVDPMSPHR
jgi:hypothetical protein